MDRELLVVSGKGGTGKSAVAAALAIRAAREGRRVLVVGMLPGAGIAAHFGTAAPGYEPEEVRDGIFAMTIERPQALDEYLHIQLKIPRNAPLGPLGKGLDVVTETVPGIRDVITIGKVLYEVDRAEWDIVIADAPPTGQIMSYLRAPATIAQLVPTSRVREQASWMEGMLADPDRSAVVLVAIPEELPVAETEHARRDLASEPLIRLEAVVANRVLPPLDVEQGDVLGLPAGPHRDAALLHLDLVADQQEQLAALQPDVALPFLFGVHTPAEVAARLADAWEPL